MANSIRFRLHFNVCFRVNALLINFRVQLKIILLLKIARSFKRVKYMNFIPMRCFRFFSTISLLLELLSIAIVCWFSFSCLMLLHMQCICLNCPVARRFWQRQMFSFFSNIVLCSVRCSNWYLFRFSPHILCAVVIRRAIVNYMAPI